MDVPSNKSAPTVSISETIQKETMQSKRQFVLCYKVKVWILLQVILVMIILAMFPKYFH